MNSLAYFVKEIPALQIPRNRSWRKKQLGNIVRRIRDNSIGRADCSTGDLVEDVKRACAREAIRFDNDILNSKIFLELRQGQTIQGPYASAVRSSPFLARRVMLEMRLNWIY